MADNKLTPEQVKKALECCKLSNEDGCLSCPLSDVPVVECSDILHTATLELINDLQADKEALIAGQRTMQKYIEGLRAELEKFKEIETTVDGFWGELQKLAMFKDKKEPTLEELLEYIETRVSSAVKDFAEELKNKAAGKCNSEYCAYIDDIDSVVKEKTGDCK